MSAEYTAQWWLHEGGAAAAKCGQLQQSGWPIARHTLCMARASGGRWGEDRCIACSMIVAKSNHEGRPREQSGRSRARHALCMAKVSWVHSWEEPA